MKIGIIGAGMIGSTLTRRLTQLGHTVTVANSRGPETLTDLTTETGATAATAVDAAHGQDLVVVTIPQVKVPELPTNLFDGVGAEVVVVDTGNYYPQQRDGLIEDIENGMPESRWAEKHLGRPVVKAFNNIFFSSLAEKGQPAGTPDRIALPVSGDDVTAKRTVIALIDELGFDALDNGGLDDSWRHQPGTPVYTADSTLEQLRSRLAEASPERKPEWKATPNSPGDFNNPR
jgi:predicted dinucleotide-binding enzyme